MTARMIMKLNVASVRATTPHVLLLTLRHPRRPALPPWTPGAHVDIRLPDGRTRQYSLCGDPEDLTSYQVAIKREDSGRGASIWLHANIAAGDDVHVSAPRNNFPLAPKAARHVIVAGGIGITPFLSMARQLVRQDQDFALHFCAQSAEAAPLLAELRDVCGSRLRTYFSGDNVRFNPCWIGAPSAGAHLYACGPQRLLDAVLNEAQAQGWNEADIHREVFQPTLDENFKPEPFDARIASTGQVLHVPADRSLLHVLNENGFDVASSCELGVCGSCICGYRDGIVIHRDSVLGVASRQDQMAPCVSRARVSVTLEM